MTQPTMETVSFYLQDDPRKLGESVSIMRKHYKAYGSYRTVLATPMTRKEYNESRGWELPAGENGSDGGYLLVIPEGRVNVPGLPGYTTWLLKEVFEHVYRSEKREALPAPQSTCVQQVAQFHDAMGVPTGAQPREPRMDRAILRKNLIAEEFTELLTAMGYEVDLKLSYTGRQADLVGIADGICDLHYVLSGTSLEYGIPEDECLAEVHRSNMAKFNPDGTINKLPNGKIVKPLGWTPPDLASILNSKIKGHQATATPCDCHLRSEQICNYCQV